MLDPNLIRDTPATLMYDPYGFDIQVEGRNLRVWTMPIDGEMQLWGTDLRNPEGRHSTTPFANARVAYKWLLTGDDTDEA